jgi:hypothetical protein
VNNSNRVFTLRVLCFLSEPTIIIHAYDAGFQAPNHNRLDVEVRQGGKVIFERGTLYCGLAQNHAVDSIHAKELVLSTVAMRPGDTDAEYFATYTPAQLEWAKKYGEGISCERETRYCDPETGSVRS